jgi:hypothetical protein
MIATLPRRPGRARLRPVIPMSWGTACLIAAMWAVAAGGPADGAYDDRRSLAKGTAPPCPSSEDVSIDVNGSELTFTDSALRTFTVEFNPRADGSFHTTYADYSGATVDIQGRAAGTVIDADVIDYATRCEHHWHLEKKARGH